MKIGSAIIGRSYFYTMDQFRTERGDSQKLRMLPLMQEQVKNDRNISFLHKLIHFKNIALHLLPKKPDNNREN